MDNGSMFAFLTVILLFSSFVKICTALSIFRIGLGLEGAAFGAVVLVLSFALALPSFEASGVSSAGSLAPEALESRFRTRLEQVADPALVKRLTSAIAPRQSAAAQRSALSGNAQPEGSQNTAAETSTAQGAGDTAKPTGEISKAPFSVLVAGFLLTELRTAFRLGLLFIIPFLVIDLVVANVLTAVGLTTISHQLVALPIKILLFLAVDGWSLIGLKLLAS